MILGKNARLLICIISIGDAKGRVMAENSTKLFYEFLKMTSDFTIYFHESCLIPDFQEALENETWQDNSLIIMENVFFHPEEAGYYCDE